MCLRLFKPVFMYCHKCCQSNESCHIYCMLSDAGAKGQRLTSLIILYFLQGGLYPKWWKPDNNDRCQGVLEQGIYISTAQAMFKKCCRILQVHESFTSWSLCIVQLTVNSALSDVNNTVVLTSFLSALNSLFLWPENNSVKTMCFRVFADKCERRWSRLYRENRWVNK